jgi:hypothetical protein
MIHGIAAPQGIQSVKFGDSQSLDAFGRLRTADPFILFESKFIAARNEPLWSERLTGAIITHGAVTGAGFVVGHTITGGTSGKTGTITAVAAGVLTYSTSNNDFTNGETITSTNGSTAVVATHNTGADLEFDYVTSSVNLRVGTVAGQRVIRQSVRYFPYSSGFSHSIACTGTFAPGKAGVKQTIMYGDSLNGLGFVLDGTTLYVLKRSNTSGVVVDTLVPQSQWSIDRLSPHYGQNPSGITLDPTKSQIFETNFQWLGVGRVRLGFNIGGVSVPVHEFLHANGIEGVYMQTPTLPVRYEIENTGTPASATTLEQICSMVASEGGRLLPGAEFSVGHTWAQERAVTVRTPVLAIRLKSAFPAGQPNRKQARFLDFEVFARTNDVLAELVHIHDPSGITAGWTSVDETSGVEFSTDISAVSGSHVHTVQPAVVPAGVGQLGTTRDITSEFIGNHSYISQNYESTNSEMFVIFVTPRTGTANVTGHISFIESE